MPIRLPVAALVCTLLPGAAGAASTFEPLSGRVSIDAIRYLDTYYRVELQLVAASPSMSFQLTSAEALPTASVGRQDGVYTPQDGGLKLDAVDVLGVSFAARLELTQSEPSLQLELAQAFITDIDNPAALSMMPLPGGVFTMGEPESSYQGPPGSFDAPEHSVVLSPFTMSQTEVTNRQYVEFLNAAEQAGMVEVRIETAVGPDQGQRLVFGTASAPADYAEQALLTLDGRRVMKDHDNADGDNDPFTGVIEPENPLNLIYIGYNEGAASGARFSVLDPRSDFDWEAICDYCDYTSVPYQIDDGSCHNDYLDWPELQPNALPSLAEVKHWPATFIRWYGAKAYALFYGFSLPTEAQWEFAAKANANYGYATADGTVHGDGTSANWNYNQENPARGHVLDVQLNEPNPLGLYNLAGNVWEWAEDWYGKDFYAEGAIDPLNADNASNKKVRRGGSWNYHESTLKSAARASDETFKGNDHFGFRVVDGM